MIFYLLILISKLLLVIIVVAIQMETRISLTIDLTILIWISITMYRNSLDILRLPRKHKYLGYWVILIISCTFTSRRFELLHSICVSKGVKSMLAACRGWRNVSNHSGSTVSHERIFENLCEFWSSEWSVLFGLI